jgi:hypothetical protein
MAVLRRSKKEPLPSATVSQMDIERLQTELHLCRERLVKLERDREVDIKRMAEMQAEIDLLRASTNRA